MATAHSPAGNAINSPTPARARMRATGQQDALTGSERGSDGKPGILNGEGDKPKWMRWRTFDRLTAEHDQFVGRSMRAAALKFGLLGSDLRD
jgi:hypothetical protein